MAHYAQLDSNNKVVKVFSGRNENDLVDGVTDWEVYYAPKVFYVKRTSYNTKGGIHYNPETGEPSEDQSKAFRKNYAGVGFTYDKDRDAFIPPKPFESWILNENACWWEAPISYPENSDGIVYEWNESNKSWDEVPTS